MNLQSLELRLSRSNFAVVFTILLAMVLSGILLLTPLASAEAARGAPDTSTGNLLMYGDKGKYSKAAIYATGSAKCGGKNTTSSKPITVSLSKAKGKSGKYIGTKVKCDAGSYNVFFLKKGDKITDANFKATTRFAAVNLPANYCSFVHKKGVTHNEVIVKDRCVGDDNPNEDTVDKYTPVMSTATTPATIIQGKKYTTTVTLKNPSGESMSPEECAGSFTQSRPITGMPTKKNNQSERPFKYNAKTKNCSYTWNVSSATSKKIASGIYTLSFNGNAFMNPTSTGYRETVVLSPTAAKETAKKEAKAQKSANSKKPNTATKKAKIVSATLIKTGTNTANFKMVVSGVDECSRINPQIDQVIKAKKKKNATKYATQASEMQFSKDGDNCLVSNTVSYSKLSKSDVKFKVSFKAGSKSIKKTSTKVELGE